MQKHSIVSSLQAVLFGTLLLLGSFSMAQVVESSRNIPLSYDVDVVVVGGSSGGVAAAVEAAKSGASVFLMSDRSYLGQDLCGNYRLWLEPGEKPDTALGQALFPENKTVDGIHLIPFSYQADVASAGLHKDKAGIALADGRYGSAQYESVQYNGDVTLTLDLQKTTAVSAVHLMAYQRASNYEVAEVAVSISSDGEIWEKAQTVPNSMPSSEGSSQMSLRLSCELERDVRWIRLQVKKTENSSRLLLGEILVEPAGSSTDRGSVVWATPLHVKKVMDKALLDSGVSFLVGCYPTDVLQDAEGRPAGIVMANRAGRQAIRAKVIVDATPRAEVARLLGAEFTPYPSGLQPFVRVVVGGSPVLPGAGLQRRDLGMGWDGRYGVTEYTVTLPMADGTFSSFAEADQAARDLTWQDGQFAASEYLFQVPPDHLIAQVNYTGSWTKTSVPLKAFQPCGLNNVFVIGGCADIPRKAAAQLLRPLELIRTGSRIGAAAGKRAAKLTLPKGITVAGLPTKSTNSIASVQEFLLGARSTGNGVLSWVPSPAREIPVLGNYDVVVIGGGTAGAPAGIAAAREGAKTLVVEYLHGLGGVGTLGRIGNYWYGNPVGFTAEINRAVGRKNWDVERKAEWYRKELRSAGADLWLRSIGNGAVLDGETVQGVVVTTPFGRGVVLCHTVIDATGNADIAAAAGAECEFIKSDAFALQGAGLGPANPGKSYANSDWSYLKDSDVVDQTRMQVVGRAKKYRNAFDICSLLTSRERRRIVGDYTLMPTDILTGKTFRDTIEKAISNFDSHGYTIHPLFRFYFPERKEPLSAFVPYRCMLPKGLSGILVTGIGASYHRDALPVVRMQADVQNQGYVAGIAAMMSARDDVPVRQIDIEQLQQHLVKTGNIQPEVLGQTAVGPTGIERLSSALEHLDSGRDYAVVLGAPAKDIIPLLRKDYQQSSDPQMKLRYAHLLGALGQSDGYDLLLNTVESRSWDPGWSFTGMGAHSSGSSEMDSMIMALGQIKNPEAFHVIAEKLRALTPKSEFSHFRACAEALAILGDPRAASVLAETLNIPGIRGHATVSLHEAIRQTNSDSTDNRSRESSLRELLLARALYRCGDSEGLGEAILRRYTEDLRGVYSTYAQYVLLPNALR